VSQNQTYKKRGKTKRTQPLTGTLQILKMLESCVNSLKRVPEITELLHSQVALSFLFDNIIGQDSMSKKVNWSGAGCLEK
jgi:hypothetical protein